MRPKPFAAKATPGVLYELHDPRRYLTPDVTADFSTVRFVQHGPDRVAVSGGGGVSRPERLKVSIGHQDGFLGEGQICYAGPGAVDRARLALAIVEHRLKTSPDLEELRCDLVGSTLSGAAARRGASPGGTRARRRARPDPCRRRSGRMRGRGPLYQWSGRRRGSDPDDSADHRHHLRFCCAPARADQADLGDVMKLRDMAHARSGDKGDISNISLIAYDRRDYERLRRLVTPARVKAHLDGVVLGEIERYELPDLGALNFVLHRALAGGVTRSLALDAHGKCLSSCLLALELDA